MRSAAETDLPDGVSLEALREVLEAYPVDVAILFGSHATGSAHSGSDFDVAVSFRNLEPTEAEYNAAFFGLSADLSETLESADVDLVDVRRCSPALAESIFDRGLLLIGEHRDVTTLRRERTTGELPTRSPRERLEEAIDKIDAHLENVAVPATENSSRDR
ncbi:type VII toxin-antitoxin system MntA family adenylyltransferase antitoxin [Natrarchaeobius oligotrophus]|uniref:Nucleotidyltransferase domain-containing protein n=1 Tax=Natrarchaeobius chitinivorans TaxID=1679083 RepID=A0A3N6MJQ1_NATCH|nr:nucleotidyltransferase domain-containing protein [Natrarchaeobius chitinivorans]RQG96091.1 nucleotidyltransferase domain-containing protein [Natrarchaeobius chitinivorans]